MLAQNRDANLNHSNIILSTNNIETKYKEIKSNGVYVGELMLYGKMFKFEDQDKNEYLVREDKY